MFLFALISPISSLIIRDCSNKTDIETVCKLVKTYKTSYPPEPYPFILNVNIKILDIVDLDWTTKTMTLFIELWTFWKDPRITITVNSDENNDGLILHFESSSQCFILFNVPNRQIEWHTPGLPTQLQSQPSKFPI